MLSATDGWRAILVIAFLCFSTARAHGPPVLVVYPEASEPYREAFAQMVDGIARETRQPLLQKVLTATTTPEAFRGWLGGAERGQIAVLLGSKALSWYAQEPPVDRTVIVGGINALPGQIPGSGVSLTLDPALYLDVLRELLPNVRRVVVYGNAREQPWIAQVEQAAAALRIEVEKVVVTDAHDVARQLLTTFDTLNPKTTALWFGRNTLTLNPDLLYSYVLEQTWDRGIATFSDSIALTKYGLLFALYPDYIEVGAEIGALIQQDHRPAGVRFSRAGQLTLNTRTARRLGIVLSDDQIGRAKPLFPEP